MSRKTSSGFTAGELLTVIVIIAVLIAILFPVFAKARNNAQANTCLSNVQKITSAFRAYAADHGDRLPPDQLGLDRIAPFGTLIEGGYRRDRTIFACPTDAGGPTFPLSDGSRMVCSYGFSKESLGAELGQFRSPADYPLVMDFRPGDEFQRFDWLWSAEVSAPPGENVREDHYRNVHGGNIVLFGRSPLHVNVGFADGSARPIVLDQLKSDLRPNGQYIPPTIPSPPAGPPPARRPDRAEKG